MFEVDNLTGVTYPPVGRCIYCGVTGDLSDEHIVAYALAGSLVLPQASCAACAKETGRVEQRCCRVYFDHIRFPLKMPSRKGKKKRGSLPIIYHKRSGDILRRHVATTDAPIGLCLPIWDRARILQGWPEFTRSRIQFGWWRFGPSNDKMRDFALAHGATGIAAHFDFPALARMLAKIAHGFCVVELGLDGFSPLATDLILGKSENWSHIVGASILDVDRKAAGGELHLLSRANQNAGAITYLVSTVQLFSRFGAPRYDVAVGTLNPKQIEQLTHN